MKKDKQASKMVLIIGFFIVLLVAFTFKSDEEVESTVVYEKMDTIEDKLKKLNGDSILEKEYDLNGDNILEKLYLVNSKDGKMFLLIDNENVIYTKEISSDIKEISFLKDVNSDNISDIFLTGFKKSEEKFVYPLISKEGEYINVKLQEGAFKVGLDLNYTVFSYDVENLKGSKTTLNNEIRADFIKNGYLDNEGNIHNGNIFLKIRDESIDLKDIDDDGKSELILNFKILSEGGVLVVSQYKIYNFDITRGDFKLTSVVNNLEDFKISKDLSEEEIKKLIYKKTNHNEEEFSYNPTGDIENIPSNIKEKFYTFFEVYNYNGNGMESDYLILVSKSDYSIYKYYVDGLMLPL